jgi:hypothetical protein
VLIWLNVFAASSPFGDGDAVCTLLNGRVSDADPTFTTLR